MEIYEIKNNKKQYLSLLLSADEQEDMIDRYLERGIMYVLDDGGVKGECVVTDEGNGTLEIKNIAVEESCFRQGFGRTLIEFIEETYGSEYSSLIVGTGDSPLTVPFYEKCGFCRFRTVKNFFTENYNRPIIEDGIQLKDMIYFKKDIGTNKIIIREYRETDCTETAKLFYETVHSVNAKDYTAEQLDAWASEIPEAEKWNSSFKNRLALVAVKNGTVAGFGDITEDGYLDRLYVHRDYQKQGIASKICDGLEQSFSGKICVHASITAKPFFEKRGYTVIKEQQVKRRGILLKNYVMEKDQTKDSLKLTKAEYKHC